MKKGGYSASSTQATGDPPPPYAFTASSSGTNDPKQSQPQECEYPELFSSVFERSKKTPEETLQQHSVRLAAEFTHWQEVRWAVDSISKSMSSRNPSEKQEIKELGSKTHNAAQYMYDKSNRWAKDAIVAVAAEGSKSGKASKMGVLKASFSMQHTNMFERYTKSTAKDSTAPGLGQRVDEYFDKAEKIAMNIHKNQARALGWDGKKLQSILKSRDAAGSAYR